MIAYNKPHIVPLWSDFYPNNTTKKATLNHHNYNHSDQHDKNIQIHWFIFVVTTTVVGFLIFRLFFSKIR